MITQLKTKVAVAIDLFDLNNKQIIYCKIENFIQDKGSYRINGSYFWLKEVNVVEEIPVYGEVVIKNFFRTFTNEELDSLFNALNIQYSVNSTYTEKRVLELNTGLKYIVTVEPILGLEGSDWE